MNSLRWLSLPICGGCVLLAGCFTHHPAPAPPPRHAAARSPYNFPLISTGKKFSGLPPAVQNTVRAEVGTLEIADIVKNTSSGRVVYEIHFRNYLLFPPLLVASDGSVLNPDLTVAVAAAQEFIGVPPHGPASGLQPSDLPPNVLKAIQERAPTAEVAFITREVWNEKDVYIISFKDPERNPMLYFSADGTPILNPQH